MEPIKIKRILIVDNNEENTGFLRMCLGKLQYQDITIATTGEEALSYLLPKRIQFIITSWEMAPMSGTAFVQRVLSQEKTNFLPFIIFSSKMSPEEIQFAKGLGLNNILSVPCSEDEVCAIIKEVIDREESMDPLEYKIREADSLRIEKHYPQAINALKPALIKGPLYTKAHTLLGEIYLSKGDYKQAEKTIENVLSEDSNYQNGIKIMAKVYSKTSRHEDAVKLLQKLTIDSPYNVAALTALGITYVEMDEKTKAKATFSKAKDIDPTNPSVNREVGKMAIEEKDFSSALKLLEETVDTAEIIGHFNNVAVGLVAKSNFDQAIETYEAAIKLMSDKKFHHILHYNLGLAFRKKGDFRKAFEILSDCYQNKPSYKKAYAALVHVVKDMESHEIKFDHQLMKELRSLYQRSR